MNKQPITSGMKPEEYKKQPKEVDLTGFVSGKELVDAYRLKTRETLTKRLKAAFTAKKISFNPHGITLFNPNQIEEIFSVLGHPYGRKE